jgi:copper binding plastocyanin/azurin family protein
MLRICLVLLAVTALSAALVNGAVGAKKPVALVGTVGPSFTITLKKNGKTVKKLAPGKYKFTIHDKASEHSWALDGPKGFAKDLTAVPFIGTKTVTLTLKAGKYKFYCPPHEANMFGKFTVG